MRAVRAAALAAAVTMTLASCSGEGDDDGAAESTGTGTVDEGAGSDAQAYAEAFAASLRQDGDDVDITDEQANCIGTRFVDVLSVERLQDLGVSPADVASGDELDFSELGLGEADGNELYDAFGACEVSLRDTIVEAMAAEESMPDDVRECLEEGYTDDVVRDFFVTAMLEGDPGSSAVSDVFQSCAGSAMGSSPSSDG